jgi:hypothetical protein
VSTAALVPALDLLGTFVFAISGAAAGVKSRLELERPAMPERIRSRKAQGSFSARDRRKEHDMQSRIRVYRRSLEFLLMPRPGAGGARA